MIRSMQEGDHLKQVGFFVRCSELREPANNITFSYVSKYMDRRLDKLSKNTVLLWSGGLYVPTINHFFKRRFISRNRVSLSSLCQFNYFAGMLSLTYMQRLPPKISLSCLNILCRVC